MIFRKKPSLRLCNARRFYLTVVLIGLSLVLFSAWKQILNKDWTKPSLFNVGFEQDTEQKLNDAAPLATEGVRQPLAKVSSQEQHVQDPGSLSVVTPATPSVPIPSVSQSMKFGTTPFPRHQEAEKLLHTEEDSALSSSKKLLHTGSLPSSAELTTPGMASSTTQSVDAPSTRTTAQSVAAVTSSVPQVQATTLNPNYPNDLEMALNYTNPHPFKYLIVEDDFCTNRYPELFMLTYVHTAPDHFDRRNAIREAWGNKNLYTSLGTATVFILGKTVDETVSAKIQIESQQYHDIIQEDFLDSYRNLTYKGVAALRWLSHFCQKPKFILKVDDDMLVNTFSLIRLLKKTMKLKPNGNQFMCLFYDENMPIIRDNNSKWYVSEQEYPGKLYLPYCSGSAYVFPNSIASRLYNVSFDTPFLWVDDVYVSGLLARAAGATHERMDDFYDLYKTKEELIDSIVFGSKLFGHFRSGGIPPIEWYREFWKNITDISKQSVQLHVNEIIK